MANSKKVDLPELPRVPADRLTAPFRKFVQIESAGGLLLLAAAVVAMIAASSPFGDTWLAFWKQPVGFTAGPFEMVHGLYWWVNDLLMAVFFFVVGLEIKREVVSGELSDRRRVALPVMAALGGAALPAAIFMALQWGTAGQDGWAVPMATDIAFVVGALALFGDRVPRGLKVLLLAVAIVDDLLAVAVIAVFYSESLQWGYLALAAGGLGVYVAMLRLGVRSIGLLGLVGAVVWFLTLQGGVHPTVAGVFLGLLTPMTARVSESHAAQTLAQAADQLRDGNAGPAALERVTQTARQAVPMLIRLENGLHPWTAFLIMPIFALANAGVVVSPAQAVDPVALAIVAGLVVGKPIGLFAASFATVRLGLGKLPEGVSWAMVIGGGMLAGIGFTMSLFIANLAFAGDTLDAARTGILVGSGVSALVGMGVLWLATLGERRAVPAAEGGG